MIRPLGIVRSSSAVCVGYRTSSAPAQQKLEALVLVLLGLVSDRAAVRWIRLLKTLLFSCQTPAPTSSTNWSRTTAHKVELAINSPCRIPHVPRRQICYPQISQRIQCVCIRTGASQIWSCGCNRYHNISRGAKISRPSCVSCFSPEGQKASCLQVHDRIFSEEMILVWVQRCYRTLLTDNLLKLTYKLIKLVNSEPLLCFISHRIYLITLLLDLTSAAAHAPVKVTLADS